MQRNAALAAVLAGCMLSTSPAFADSSITAAGSTALLPLVKDAAGAYVAANPGVKIRVFGGGSGTGIYQVVARSIDIGDSDLIEPSPSELRDHRVAVIGFAVVINPELKVNNLTRVQIRDIFSGKVTNWSQIGGPDQKIVVINRGRGSGARVVFEKTIIAGNATEVGMSEEATGTLIGAVSQTPGAISYAPFSETHGEPITEVAIDGVAPTRANIIDGAYPFWSYEHMFTNGPPTGEVRKFIAFVQSSGDLIAKDGFIKISDMQVSETNR